MRAAPLALLASLLALAGDARGQIGPPGGGLGPVEPAPDAWSDLPQFDQLPSGLRICVLEDRSLPLVSVQLCFRGGAAADPPDRPGLCHLARTLLAAHGDAALKLQALGAAARATTERDYVSFESVCHPRLVEQVIDIAAARLIACTRPRDVFAGTGDISGPPADGDLSSALASASREALGRPRPEGKLERRVLAALFAGHPYDDPPWWLGASLQDVTISEVSAFVERWFTPANATLFIIGDVSEAAIRDYAKRLLADLPYRDGMRVADPAALPAVPVTLDAIPAASAGSDFVFLTPPLGAFDNAALDVLLHRLCNPVDGLLDMALRRAGLAPPSFRRESWAQCGTLRLSIDSPGPTADADIEDIVRAALHAAAEHAAQPIEHVRARSLAVAAARQRRAAFANRAARLAEFELVAGDILLEGYEIPQIERVSVTDVQTAAQFLLETRRVVVRRVRADACGDAASGETPPAPGSRTSTPRRFDAGGRLDALAGFMPSAWPPFQGFAASPVITRTLANGVRLTVCQLPLPEACVRTLLPRARGAPDVAALAMRFGSAQRSAAEILDYATWRGIELGATPAPYPTLSATGRPADVAQMLELQAELLRKPQRDAAIITRRLAELRAKPASLRNADVRPEVHATPPTDIPTDAAGVLRAWDAVEPLPPPCILVVGDVDPNVVADQTAQLWGDLQPTPCTAPAGPPTDSERDAASIRVTAGRAMVKAAIRVIPSDRPDSGLEKAAGVIQTLLADTWSASGASVETRSDIVFTLAGITDSEVETAVDEILQSIAWMRDDKAPLHHAMAAGRLAAARRWLELDSAAAICDALERVQGDPWVQIALAANTPPDRAVIAGRIGHCLIEVSACDAVVRDRIAGRSSVPEGAASRSATP
jgi:zinc protease